MARSLRLEFPGALYHVTARGNRREEIYLDTQDRVRFLDLLGEVCEMRCWRCHGYCLMSNHYHLILETAEANLGRGMRQLNGVYTQRFNRRHGRVGHVFQGRYTAILVDKDAYLMELARYVVLNPVRAGIVASPGQWPWSSYQAMIGKAPCPPWLEMNAILGTLAGQRKAALERYIAWVAAGKGVRLWQQLSQRMYLGDARFVDRMQQRLGTAQEQMEIPKAERRPAPPPLDEYARRYPDRKTAMAQAFASGCYTLKTIAKYFGVHYSTVSRAVRGRGGWG